MRTGGDQIDAYYVILDFSTGVANANLMYTDIKGTQEAFFVGSKYEIDNDMKIHQAYITGFDDRMKAKSGYVADYVQEVGVVLSSLRGTESCIEMPNLKVQLPLTSFPDVSVTHESSEFGTTTFVTG